MLKSKSFVDIKSDDVRLLSAPHYEGLTVEAFLGYCDQIEMMKDYLPDKEEERKRLPRAFIISVDDYFYAPGGSRP